MGKRIDIQDELVIERYKELKNLKKVAKSFGVSLRPIYRILNRNNIELTNRIYEVNHNFFSTIDTEEKAYWLGFLFADGCVRTGNTGSQLVLKLSVKDLEHLKKFKKNISSEHKIVFNTNKTKTKKGIISVSENCLIRVSSCEFVNNLINCGCTPNKTFTIDKPNIEEKYYRHFLRGFYDGDGNFFFSEKTKMSVVTIVCASDNFRKFIVDILQTIPNIGKIHVDDKKYTIKIVNILGIIEFLSYIYDESKIELTRKKEYYEKYREYRRSIESDYQWGLCGSYVKTTK